jgi:predicted ABC-type ATPase
MIHTANPKLRMLAGPNGSGKSTVFSYLRREFSFPFGYCLNPDEIDRELKECGRLYLGAWGVELDDATLSTFVSGHGLANRLRGKVPRVEDNGLVVKRNFKPGYFTSIFCDLLRRQWMAREESFTFETVMSHPDRVELMEEARRRGYRTYLYYVCTDSVSINAERIESRFKQGGHDVPGSVIGERYRRSLALLPRAIAASSRAYLFDNSGSKHRFVAEYESAKPVRFGNDLPRWLKSAGIAIGVGKGARGPGRGRRKSTGEWRDGAESR